DRSGAAAAAGDRQGPEMVMRKLLAEPDADEPARPMELTPEEVSLLMDGELDADRAERACRGLREVASVQTWVCYHVIGDCLRGDRAPTWGISKRFAARLAAEPTRSGRRPCGARPSTNTS